MLVIFHSLFFLESHLTLAFLLVLFDLLHLSDLKYLVNQIFPAEFKEKRINFSPRKV